VAWLAILPQLLYSILLYDAPRDGLPAETVAIHGDSGRCDRDTVDTADTAVAVAVGTKCRR